MNDNKLFNSWISKNFKGLSARTLRQLVLAEVGWKYFENHIMNMIYVDLFHVFTNTATDNELETYNTIASIVNNCAWL